MKIRKHRIGFTILISLMVLGSWFLFYADRNNVTLFFCIFITIALFIAVGNVFYLVNFKDDPEYNPIWLCREK